MYRPEEAHVQVEFLLIPPIQYPAENRIKISPNVQSDPKLVYHTLTLYSTGKYKSKNCCKHENVPRLKIIP